MRKRARPVRAWAPNLDVTACGESGATVELKRMVMYVRRKKRTPRAPAKRRKGAKRK